MSGAMPWTFGTVMGGTVVRETTDGFILRSNDSKFWRFTRRPGDRRWVVIEVSVPEEITKAVVGLLRDLGIDPSDPSVSPKIRDGLAGLATVTTDAAAPPRHPALPARFDEEEEEEDEEL